VRQIRCPVLTKAERGGLLAAQIKPDAPHVTLNPMPRRTQLAFALILLLVLAPLAGVTCGIQCLGATPHHPMVAATTQRHCVSATACCHSTRPAICNAANTADISAALLVTGTHRPHAAPAITVATTEALQANPRAIAVHRIDSSPPGWQNAGNSSPLRI
jgi:hypothetical protein